MRGGRSSATYASLGFFYDGGWTVADRVQRITANLKNTFYLGERLQVTLSAQGNIRSQNAPGTLPQRKNTTLGLFERDFDINPFSYALGTSRTLLPSERYRNNWAPFNIHQEYHSNHMDIGVLDFKAQAEASYKVFPHLEARASSPPDRRIPLWLTRSRSDRTKSLPTELWRLLRSALRTSTCYVTPSIPSAVPRLPCLMGDTQEG